MRCLITILVLLLFTSCNYDTTWNIQLWEQKIENSEFSIYKFNAWGGRDTNVSGMKLLNSNIGFQQSDVMKGEKLSYLISIPNKNKIEGVFRLDRANVQDKSFPKIKNTEISIKGYKNFNIKKGECSYEDFNFESFKEIRDSIIFYSNKAKFVNGTD